MYNPPVFQFSDLTDIHRTMRHARTATLVTATDDGLVGTQIPIILDDQEGERGTLYAHVARANPQWRLVPRCDGLAIFNGPEAYVTPSWYATKRKTHKVVPTWNYVAIHAYGPVEFFEDENRLLTVVTRLTDLHENARADRWAVRDAPADFIKSQLKGIIGVRMPIARIDAKRKLSQNRSPADRAGIIQGLSTSNRPEDRVIASMIPKD